MIEIKEDFSLKSYNTFGINIRAKYFSEFSSVDDLSEILERFHDHQQMVLGGGSNVLLTKNFGGIVLKNNIPAINVVNEDEEFVYVKAGAGVSWHQIVMYCVNSNFGGVENLSLIPGNI